MGSPDGASVFAATARVEGRPVVCYAHDRSIAAGSLGTDEAATIVHALRLARRAAVPVVIFAESAGARLHEGAPALAACARILCEHAKLSSRSPQIAIVTGNCAGAGAYASALSDFLIMTPRAALFLTGPRVVRTAIGENVDAATLGGPSVQSRNGVSQLVARDERDATRLARKLLAFLPHRVGAPAPRTSASEPDLRDTHTGLPASSRRGYDVRTIARAILDGGTWLEVSPGWAPNLVTAIARIDGLPVGIVATQPNRLGGLVDVDAAQKAAAFVRTCDRFGLPLLVLVDSPGFLPGKRQEAAGIIRHGSELLRAFATARVPKITVIMRKAFGGAYIALNAHDLDADLTYAWSGAQIGIMSAESAIAVVGSGTSASSGTPPGCSRYLREMSAEAAAAHGLVDDVIAPCETRERLVVALARLMPSTRGGSGRTAATRRPLSHP